MARASPGGLIPTSEPETSADTARHLRAQPNTAAMSPRQVWSWRCCSRSREAEAAIRSPAFVPGDTAENSSMQVSGSSDYLVLRTCVSAPALPCWRRPSV